MQEQTIDPINTLLAEFGTRINEVEEKQRLLRDRALLIGENLISTKEDYDTQNNEIKKQIDKLNLEIKNLKQLSQRIVNELGNLARKSELDILKKQFEMFDPLKIARIKDVELMIQNALDKKSKSRRP